MIGFCGLPGIAGVHEKDGEPILVVKAILPLFSPQVVGLGAALAVGKALAATTATAVAVHPLPDTVTV